MRSAMVWSCAVVVAVLSAGAPAAETAPDAPKLLEGLKPAADVWGTYVECVSAAAKYLKIEVSPAWIAGVGGQAFGLNIQSQLSPSGPHVWSGWGNLRQREGLLGLRIERLGSWFKGHDDQYEVHQKQAWERCRQAIDAGSPVIGYDFSWAEFYLVNGYDATGYYFWKTDMGDLKQAGPVAWEKYGLGGSIHMIDLQFLTSTAPTGTTREAVKAALQFAVDFSARGDADDPQRQADYVSGLAGYQAWLAALGDPACWQAPAIGAMYNAHYWRECRRFAVGFLQEAKGRLKDPELDDLFDDAIASYQQVEQDLSVVCEQFWFDTAAQKDPQPVRLDRCRRALTDARQAEAAGVAILAELVKLL